MSRWRGENIITARITKKVLEMEECKNMMNHDRNMPLNKSHKEYNKNEVYLLYMKPRQYNQNGSSLIRFRLQYVGVSGELMVFLVWLGSSL
ncbi:hypothetical protein ES288_D05G231900v1 [Gossypium darwinii]|uniref:Uncharacterized protein n=1 Tax=Gossypium darwinii TaxID=34276 RepID=A0A5D2CIQ9_GOSDA|nr:hypothetical protein ES288_D05G231900v1 [Gossypium darwinii]